MIGWKELMIVLLIVLLVFGTRKLGTLGKDLGQALGGFRKGMAEGSAADATMATDTRQSSAEQRRSGD